MHIGEGFFGSSNAEHAPLMPIKRTCHQLVKLRFTSVIRIYKTRGSAVHRRSTTNFLTLTDLRKNVL